MKKISILGGDLRNINLVTLLAKDFDIVYTYGLEKAENLQKNEKVVSCRNLEELINNTDVLIAPIPFSKNDIDLHMPFSDSKITIEEIIDKMKAKKIISGSIKQEIVKKAEDNHIEIIDIMKNESLAILNTIATAEGTIEIIISNTNKILQEEKILVLGFGRVGKILTNKLKMLNCNVTCATIDKEELSWIRAYGYIPKDLHRLKEEYTNFDVIVNTIPSLILDKEKINFLKQDVLLIDLASAPGGVDKEYIKEKNIKFIHALALPGKVAPYTSAEFIKEAIYQEI